LFYYYELREDWRTSADSYDLFSI